MSGGMDGETKDGLREMNGWMVMELMVKAGVMVRVIVPVRLGL